MALNRTALPPDLAAMLETIWRIKQERASAAAEVAREKREMDEFARDERRRRYGPDPAVIRENGARADYHYTEVQ